MSQNIARHKKLCQISEWIVVLLMTWI